MKTRRMAKMILVGAVALFTLVATGTVDVRVDWNPGSAAAIDLFGEESTEEAGPFWTEGGGMPVPEAMAALPSLADLAERISPAVVNIKTSKTV